MYMQKDDILLYYIVLYICWTRNVKTKTCMKLNPTFSRPYSIFFIKIKINFYDYKISFANNYEDIAKKYFITIVLDHLASSSYFVKYKSTTSH